MADNYKYIGKYVPMQDIREKVTGKLKYVGDMKLHGMLYGKLLLSSIAHGIIEDIDTSQSELLPGVECIFTYKNTPNNKYNSHKWYEGHKVPEDETMFTDKVRFVGDKVAAVVAKDLETAERAISLIKVKYKELTPVIDPEEALKESSPKVHGDTNLIFSKELKYGDCEDEFSKAEFIVKDRVTTPKVHHAAIEPHICLSKIDEFNNITVWSPCQGIFQIQLIVSQALGIPKSKVRVIKTAMGGSFGGKTHPILEPISAYASLVLKKPVQFSMDRSQVIIGTRTRHNMIGNVKTALNKEGIILARDIDVLVDTGAYFTNGIAIAMAMGKKISRLYKIKNQKYNVNVVYTNTPVGGPCRGYGSPQIHAITEINIDNAAKMLNMDPVELRLKNLLKPYDKDLGGGTDIGNGRVIDCVKYGAKAFKWKERWPKIINNGRYVRGVGMACVTHGNGYFGAYPDFLTTYVRMDTDGYVTLKQTVQDLGCGTVITMKQIAAEVLNIDINKIHAAEGDTLVTPYDSAGTQASRVTYVCGGAVKKACELLVKKIINYCALILHCTEDKIVMKNEMIWCKDNTSYKLSYKEAAIIIEDKYDSALEITNTYTSQANPAVYAADFAEVEVDTLTGLVRVTDLLAVHDIGKAINRTLVEGQIQGGAQMGIGYALTEEIKIDAGGNIKSNTLSKYHLINAPDMPTVKIILIEEGDEYGPYGGKSVGEIATNGIAPAIINAINHTLGINITTLPATPERIISALKEKKKLSLYRG
ncbi:xanthine dehydrogenase family protein molybdopterin-binding subunit [Clostridium ljungdahlii]|uniref:Xanthine dehydrogenase molybdenum-binding subunit n=1 Tax=Clostridium ljungdahlii TaxID=1538 RepID=A0A170NLD4_9CLOT|nr:molybdopterin cofactor-binding domain-containing protein [Clostridium ljungdahlii]OAA92191.1 Xanthine dehydrogenase molybdenum-binding subunit [Clostridium ljungdahlii]